MKKVTLIPGDGIGPEIVNSVKKIFKAAGVQIEWEEINAGQASFDECGELLPQSLLNSIRNNKIALKAPLTTPVGKGFRSVNVQLRKELDLYANVRPIKTIEGILTPLSSAAKIDLVIVRENTEGLYAGVEHMVGDDAAETIRVITRKASERIGRYALKTVVERNNILKNRLTIVHKANIMKLTDGLFLNSIKDISEKYISEGSLHRVRAMVVDDRIIDNMCMQLIQRPETFDVIVAPNFHGDIISDLCAALIGGLGVAPGANIGDDCAVYEAIHGTAPDIAGQNKANPTSLLLSACMMLRDKSIGDIENADRIEASIFKTIKEGCFVTGDIVKEDGTRGTGTTDSYTDAIIKNL
jgi:isocitrate dehydrogenase (NAD+)